VTSKVLTMEYIEGVKITQLGGAETEHLDRAALADTFVKAMVQQILIEGFFHADVHPGNVFVEPKTGQIVFIDLGMTGSLDAWQRARLIDLMRGLAERDPHQLTNVVLDLGDSFKPVDPDALERDIGLLAKKHLSGSLADFSYAKFLSELLKALFNNGVRTPSDLMFALKAIMQTEQIVRTLNPDFNITELAGTASSQVLAHQMRPAALLSYATTTLSQVLRIAPMMGDAVEQYMRDTRSGKRITRLDPGDIQHIGQLVTSTANRFMMIVLLVGVMLSSVLVMALPYNEALPFLPWIGLIGFGGSVLIATLLVLRLLWVQWRK
jgi:ubiquinone biosynthesis protein